MDRLLLATLYTYHSWSRFTQSTYNLPFSATACCKCRAKQLSVRPRRDCAEHLYPDPPTISPEVLTLPALKRWSAFRFTSRAPPPHRRRFVVGGSNFCFVSENPTCFVPALWECEGIWPCDYCHATTAMHDNEYTPQPSSPAARFSL